VNAYFITYPVISGQKKKSVNAVLKFYKSDLIILKQLQGSLDADSVKAMIRTHKRQNYATK